MRLKFPLFIIIISCLIYSCNNNKEKRLITASKQKTQLTAKEILGNPDYLAISYGGYRKTTRGIQPTITEIKEDMKILHAMNIKILRTYNVQFAQAETILKAIKELFKNDIPVISSTKSMTGHSLGATGVQEAIYSIMMLKEKFIAPSINIDELCDEAEGVNIATETIEKDINSVLSNSFGFGGTNATLVMSRYND